MFLEGPFVSLSIDEGRLQVSVPEELLSQSKVPARRVVHPATSSVPEHMGSSVREPGLAERLVVGLLDLPVGERSAGISSEDEPLGSHPEDGLQGRIGLGWRTSIITPSDDN